MRLFYAFSRPSGLVPEGLFCLPVDQRGRYWISRGRVIAGCYIGKAEFKGEDMKMYPFFGTSAVPIE